MKKIIITIIHSINRNFVVVSHMVTWTITEETKECNQTFENRKKTHTSVWSYLFISYYLLCISSSKAVPVLNLNQCVFLGVDTFFQLSSHVALESFTRFKLFNRISRCYAFWLEFCTFVALSVFGAKSKKLLTLLMVRKLEFQFSAKHFDQISFLIFR